MTQLTTKPRPRCCVPGCDRPMLARCAAWSGGLPCDRPVCVAHGASGGGGVLCPECDPPEWVKDQQRAEALASLDPPAPEPDGNAGWERWT